MTNVLRLQNLNGNTIKQGDKTPIKYELIDFNNTLEEINGATAKIYLSNGIGVIYKSEAAVTKNDNKYYVEFPITDLLVVNTYYLEIVVNGKYVFPSDDTERIWITSSTLGFEVSKANTLKLYDEIIDYGINNELFQELVVSGKDGLDGQDGVNGKDGRNGNDGTSVTVEGFEYDGDGNTRINFSDNNVVTVKKGKDGINGVNGIDGKNGKDAQPLTVTEEAEDSNGNTIITFSDESTVMIKKGRDGNDGSSGVDGKSAYEIAVKNGYDGDEASWLSSLKGKNGINGENGKDGQQGPKGEKGEQGLAGKDGNATSFLIVADVDDVTAFLPISSGEYNAMRYFRDNTITDEFMKGYSNYIAKEGIKETVSTIKEDYSKVISGEVTVIEGNDNPYTTIVGTTIEYKFTGTSISMTANCNPVGGLWKATIDGQFIKNISTYGSAITTFLISDQLESKEHVLLLEFIGEDPSHPTDKPRGWIRTGKYNSTHSSFTVTNTVKENGMINIVDVAFPSSNKEYAISVTDNDKTKKAEFFPYHGTQTSFKGENYVKQLIVDGNNIPLNEPSDKIWFTEATLIQKVEHKLSTDSSIRMEATFIVTFKDNKIYNDVRFKWIQPSIVTSGYVFQMPFDTNFLDTVVVGDTEQVDKSLNFGTQSEFKNKDAKIYRGVSSLPISKDFVYQFTVTENSIPMNRLWLQHRDERLQKLYPQYYNQSQKQSGDIDIFRGYYEIKKIKDANKVYKL